MANPKAQILVDTLKAIETACSAVMQQEPEIGVFKVRCGSPNRYWWIGIEQTETSYGEERRLKAQCLHNGPWMDILDYAALLDGAERAGLLAAVTEFYWRFAAAEGRSNG